MKELEFIQEITSAIIQMQEAIQKFYSYSEKCCPIFIMNESIDTNPFGVQCMEEVWIQLYRAYSALTEKVCYRAKLYGDYDASFPLKQRNFALSFYYKGVKFYCLMKGKDFEKFAKEEFQRYANTAEYKEVS